MRGGIADVIGPEVDVIIGPAGRGAVVVEDHVGRPGAPHVSYGHGIAVQGGAGQPVMLPRAPGDHGEVARGPGGVPISGPGRRPGSRIGDGYDSRTGGWTKQISFGV